jgi:hypothetical protein
MKHPRRGNSLRGNGLDKKDYKLFEVGRQVFIGQQQVI